MHEKLFLIIEQFVELSADDRRVIERLFVPREFEKGEHFLWAGEVCREVLFIETGIFRHFLNREGEELIYFFAAENDFVSDYESFLSGEPSDKNIQALEAARGLTINREDLQHFYSDVKFGERFGRLALEQIFVANLRQVTSFYQDTPAERYQSFVRNYQNLQNRIPQYYIASYVGIKPESLSRIRRRATIRQKKSNE